MSHQLSDIEESQPSRSSQDPPSEYRSSKVVPLAQDERTYEDNFDGNRRSQGRQYQTPGVYFLSSSGYLAPENNWRFESYPVLRRAIKNRYHGRVRETAPPNNIIWYPSETDANSEMESDGFYNGIPDYATDPVAVGPYAAPPYEFIPHTHQVRRRKTFNVRRDFPSRDPVLTFWENDTKEGSQLLNVKTSQKSRLRPALQQYTLKYSASQYRSATSLASVTSRNSRCSPIRLEEVNGVSPSPSTRSPHSPVGNHNNVGFGNEEFVYY
ncbi:unnamed protein product [Calicophoron daubneyi]|uniref:Uncharacterized protein n=1 Tax=Calicophoron daubneyi TaxID=300641 RepID=A0AAV2TST8_CALDB